MKPRKQSWSWSARRSAREPGMKILELGCGWGSFAKYAAEKYGVPVVGVTVSKEQVALGQELCQGLPVELRLQDYREVQGQFDAVISIGVMEHVGYKNYRDLYAGGGPLSERGWYCLYPYHRWQQDHHAPASPGQINIFSRTACCPRFANWARPWKTFVMEDCTTSVRIMTHPDGLACQF